MAIEHKNYSYGFVMNVIKNKMTEYTQNTTEQKLPEHKNIRGKDYFNKQLTINF